MPPSPSQILSSLLSPHPETPSPRPSNRRVRTLLNGIYIVDTTRAIYVWEHPYYPYFYVPGEELKNREGVVVEEKEDVEGKARVWEVRVGERRVGGLWFGGKVRWGGKSEEGEVSLEGMVRLGFGEMDAWYEEDAQIYGHPKDPTKRIFVLPSSRPLLIKIGSHIVVDINNSNNTTSTSTTQSKTSHPVQTSYIRLIESTLPPRYYLPPTAIHQSILRPSPTRTYCPYKGEAEYYDIVLPAEDGDGKKEVVYRDLVWYYKAPLLECVAVTGMLCFYNEKVDIWVDGEKVDRARSHFV